MTYSGSEKNGRSERRFSGLAPRALPRGVKGRQSSAASAQIEQSAICEIFCGALQIEFFQLGQSLFYQVPEIWELTNFDMGFQNMDKIFLAKNFY